MCDSMGCMCHLYGSVIMQMQGNNYTDKGNNTDFMVLVLDFFLGTEAPFEPKQHRLSFLPLWC